VKEENEFPEISSALSVFEKYEFEIPARKLPIVTKKDEILRELENNSVIIIQAATGSGKSSQVPQYILENAYQKKRNVNIIVTQPRRIPAKTLADRVSKERNCEVGSLVGFQVGQNKEMNNIDTRILFLTTGVLLRKLVNEKSLAKYTHILIDEVHERDLNLDFLLLVIRRIKNATNSHAKIILMSATMNVNHIAEYFKTPFPPKILDLDVKPPFPTKVSFLDEFETKDFVEIRKDDIDLEHPYIDYRFYTTGVELISQLIEKGVESFLVFLPGWYEIESFQHEIHKKPEIVNNFKILMLHSTMGIDSVDEVFDRRISRKIVLSTNIAESSITIPDIDFVIDFCLTKHLETDTCTNLDQLRLVYASKNNLKQREGRVGRTKAGQVIHLIYKEHFDRLPEEAPAEMQRTSLESVVLQSKRLNMGTPIDILGK
jgi:ATP-dependent RNA helicase TDRD9